MLMRLDAVSHRFILMWGWRRAVTAVLAGALSALALPPFNLLPILWLTVPVFVWLLDGSIAPPGVSWLRRMAPAFVTGWCFGFGYFVGGLWWLGAAFLIDAAQFAWLMPAAVLALPAGLALFWGSPQRSPRASGARAGRACWPWRPPWASPNGCAAMS